VLAETGFTQRRNDATCDSYASSNPLITRLNPSLWRPSRELNNKSSNAPFVPSWRRCVVA
jgi:hypothetical protein